MKVLILLLMCVPLVTPSIAVAQAESETTYETRNGQRSAAELQSELLAAGYAGPWDAASMLAAYERAGLPGVPPYATDTAWSCFDTNPSCARDPWWAEWNELQDTSHVSYSGIGAHLVTERRFDEAVDLVWQWPEGKALLRQADSSGVLVIALSYDQQTAFATYSPQRKLIAINSRFTTAPTWMLADVMAHELSHAADDANGMNGGSTAAACFQGETAAAQVQQRFLVWLTRSLRPEGLPSVAVVSGRLSREQGELAQSLYEIGSSQDIRSLIKRDYDGTC